MRISRWLRLRAASGIDQGCLLEPLMHVVPTSRCEKPLIPFRNLAVRKICEFYNGQSRSRNSRYLRWLQSRRCRANGHKVEPKPVYGGRLRHNVESNTRVNNCSWLRIDREQRRLIATLQQFASVREIGVIDLGFRETKLFQVSSLPTEQIFLSNAPAVFFLKFACTKT